MRVPTLIPSPTVVEAAGNKPKLIREYVGRVNSDTSGLSIAHMQSPTGWVEPGQTPEFDEYTLVLTTRLVGNTSLQQMYSVGVRPENKRVVVAKGVVSPRPAYEPIAAQIVLVNTPGVTTSDLSRFAYKRRRRPLYPFEPEARYGDEARGS